MDEQNYTPPYTPPTASMPPVAAAPISPTPISAAPYAPLAQAQKPKSQLPQIAIVISISVIAAIAIGLFVWTSVQLHEARADVEGKISLAVDEAKGEQRIIDDAKLEAALKEPRSEFTGPDDYGRLSFMYPRTWSVYVAANAANGGNFEAYFNPRIVTGPVNASNHFALRVTIYDRPYDEVLRSFDSLVNSSPPKLTSNVFYAGEKTGTRLEGEFSRDITGIAVLLAINDKTVYIRTDTPEVTRADFETLIHTIRFN